MLRFVSFTFLVCVIATLSGCGPSFVPVKGVVTLDGSPVEAATVTFVSEDGKNSFSGFTDASGNFELSGGNKPGALAGTYKVIVTKTKQVAGAENMTPGGGDYLKQMEKDGKEDIKTFGKGPMMGKPGPGMKMPGMKMPGMGKGGKAKIETDLPPIYAAANTSPITITVPPPSQPVAIELKSK